MLDELARLRDDGLVIGLSSSGPGQAATIRRALEATADGVAPFACVQATWNLLEPSAGPALAEASAAGWGVIVKEAVANGRLTPHGHGPAAAVLGRVAAGHGVGVDAVALAAVLANPWADVVLSGAVTPAQLEANLAAVGVELDPGRPGGAGRPGRAPGALLGGTLRPLLVLSGRGAQLPGGRLATGSPVAWAATQSRRLTPPLSSE